jgi:hypothetical protein
MCHTATAVATNHDAAQSAKTTLPTDVERHGDDHAENAGEPRVRSLHD